MNDQVITHKGRTFPIFLLLIIGVLAILLWWKSCGTNDNINPQVAKLQEKARLDSIQLESKLKIIRDSAKDLRGEKELSDSMLSDAAKDLEKMFQANAKLRAEHAKTAAPIPAIDSGQYIVAGDYVSECENCFTALQKLEDIVRAANKTVDKLGSIHQRQMDLKDREIGLYQTALTTKGKDYNDLLDKYAKVSNGKASLSGGIEYGYSPVNTNIGAYLTFRNKKGHEISVDGGGNSQSSWYLGFRLGARIF